MSFKRKVFPLPKKGFPPQKGSQKIGFHPKKKKVLPSLPKKKIKKRFPKRFRSSGVQEFMRFRRRRRFRRFRRFERFRRSSGEVQKKFRRSSEEARKKLKSSKVRKFKSSKVQNFKSSLVSALFLSSACPVLFLSSSVCLSVCL